MTTPIPITPAHVADLKLELELPAPPEKVWAALTDEIDRWWPDEFYCGGGEGPRHFVLEARPGGRMFEDHGGGDGLLWGTVVNVQRPSLLAIAGTSWGPHAWLGNFALSASDGGTKLTFSVSSFGRVNEAGEREKEKGWRFLFEGCMRAYIAGTEAPRWVD